MQHRCQRASGCQLVAPLAGISLAQHVPHYVLAASGLEAEPLLQFPACSGELGLCAGDGFSPHPGLPVRPGLRRWPLPFFLALDIGSQANDSLGRARYCMASRRLQFLRAEMES